MKIFLIRPKMVQEKPYEPPLGIAYLAAVLEKEGFHAEILDLVKENNPGLIAKEIKSRKPDIIGIGFETENRWIGFETIKIAKSVLPRALVVAGGVHASLTAENTLRNICELDAIIRGEGGETLLEFCKAAEGKVDLSKIEGLSFRRGKDIIHNPDRPPIQNLDSLPFPAYHLLLSKQYLLWNKNCCSVITSRGCPYNCSFCSITAFWGNRCRVRSIPGVMEEIGYLTDKYRIKKIVFRDDTFTLDKKRIIQFCLSLISARKRKGWNFSWACNIRCDGVISKDLLAIMKEAGCREVCTGIELAAPSVLSELKKNIDLEQARNIVEWCGQLGLKICCGSMIGLPIENKVDFKKTLGFMDELKKIPHVKISAPSLLKIYPGTELERLAYQQGILPSDFNWSKINNLTGIHGVPYFVKKDNFKEINRFTEEADILSFKLRLKYEGFKIGYFWDRLKRLKINSVKDIKKYSRKIAILIVDFFLHRKVLLLKLFILVFIWGISVSSVYAHLCDNVFRQVNKLIVKPERYNLTVKAVTKFKIFLQNNMNCGIAEICLIPESKAFDFTVAPLVMSIPKGARVYFEVKMRPKKEVRSGSYPVNFRLIGGGRQFKSFSVTSLSEKRMDYAPELYPEFKGSARESREEEYHPEKLLKVPISNDSLVLDGLFSEDLWKKAAVAANFSVLGKGEPRSQTILLLTYDVKNLYLGVYCSNPAGEKKNSRFDKVTVRLANNNKDEWYEIVFSVNSPARICKVKGLEQMVWWLQEFKYAVTSNVNSWNVETVIPFSDMQMNEPANNQVHFMRVSRESRPSGEISFWASDQNGYNEELGFGKFIFVR